MTIYNVTIKFSGEENRFQITWHNVEKNTQDCFTRESEVTPEDTQRLWQWSRCQLGIGQKLFRFLDGEAHHFQQALTQAKQLGEKLQLHLRTCKEAADWPFELLAKDDSFLLPHGIHLVRYVSGWAQVGHSNKTKQKFCGGPGGGFLKEPPGRRRQKDRPLKLLFMACSAMDVEPELDFEREEEAIFHITEKLAVDMDVEDSGSLEGLRSKVVQDQYDVIHLSGHADINKIGRPYFIMEDETGYARRVFPDELWNEALIENPPQLLFLSGCRTGEVPESSEEPGNIAEGSFARLLVEKYQVPAVLGWGRTVKDDQAIHAGKMIFHELSRGKSILDAVQRARFELTKNFPTIDKPAWPLLRLFSSGVPLEPIVEGGQRWQPKPQRMKHVYLKNSEIKVLSEGFVGRRRQLQTGLRALKHNPDKVGLLLLGTGGLGKSCLAGKICERFPDHTLVIVHGRFNTITLGAALEDAFIASQDERGQKILSEKKTDIKEVIHDISATPGNNEIIQKFLQGPGTVFSKRVPGPRREEDDSFMADKLARLCASSFKERNYLLLLDDFEQNLEGADRGEPGSLLPEAADLLEVLLRYLPHSGKMTQMIITSRYEFSLSEQHQNLIEEKLEKVWLTGFRESEQLKKVRELRNIFNYEEQSLVPQLLKAGCGNPRLMEWLDILVGQMEAAVPRLLEAVKDKQEEFIREHVIRELLQRGGKELELFLRWFSIYRRPVMEEGVKKVAEKADLSDWKELLNKGMSLSLIEHDQARWSYQVTPLLREELLKGLEDHQASHEAAFVYYKKVCEAKDAIDPVLTEEWIFHALSCGEEDVASDQGGNLVEHLRDRLAFQESRRIGEWVLAEKKRKCSTTDEAFLLNALGLTINDLGDRRQSIEYFEKALVIWKNVYGENEPNVASALNNIGSAWRDLGEPNKAIDYYQKAFSIDREVHGEENPEVGIRLNNLGSIYDELGDHRQAIEYFEKALTIFKKVYGEKHSNVAMALNNLGFAWRTLGEPNKAIDYYLRALSIDRAVHGEEHPDVARDLNNIGDAWNSLGEYKKTINYYQQALNIFKKFFGERHPYVAMALNNIGETWRALGQPNKAIDCYLQGLSIDQPVYGEKHPEVAIRLNNLGLAKNSLGDHSEAIEYFEKALVIWKHVYGETHANVAIALNNIGEAWRALSQPNKAIDYYQRALSIDRAVYGMEHPEVAVRLNNLGLAWDQMGDYLHANEYFENALAIWKHVYGETHPSVAITLNNIGEAWRALGQPEKAIDYYQKALSIDRVAYGEEHPEVAIRLNNLGLAKNSLGDHSEANEYFEKALAIWENVYGEKHPNVAITLNNIGEVWRALGQPEKTIDCCQKALSINRALYGEEHFRVGTTLNNLGMAYFQLGQTEQAKDYFEKAYEVFYKFLEPGHPNLKAVNKSLKVCKRRLRKKTTAKRTTGIQLRVFKILCKFFKK